MHNELTRPLPSHASTPFHKNKPLSSNPAQPNFFFGFFYLLSMRCMRREWTMAEIKATRKSIWKLQVREPSTECFKTNDNSPLPRYEKEKQIRKVAKRSRN